MTDDTALDQEIKKEELADARGWEDRPTAPQNHKYDTSQYLDLEKEAQEMKAAKCQKCFDSGTIREDGVDGHMYACDCTAPQNAEALEALKRCLPVMKQVRVAAKDHIIWSQGSTDKPYLSLEHLESLALLCAALNQPRTAKIDGLREAIEIVLAGYDFDEVKEAAPEYAEAMDKVLEAARAQLAAQEGGAR